MVPPQIAVSFSRNIPMETFRDFVDTIASEKLDLRVESRERDGPYAGLEWLIPTAVIIFIGKSYFDAFLKEMGKDHYHVLKAGLKALRTKVLGPSAPKVSVVSSSGKISAARQYSLTFSIMAEADERLRFKLLLRDGSSESDYEQVIETFLAFLAAYHEHSLGPQMIDKLKAARVVGGTLLLAFDPDTKTLEPVDPVPTKSRNEA